VKFLFAILISLLLSCQDTTLKSVRWRADGNQIAFLREDSVVFAFHCTFPEEEKFAVRDGFDYWNGIIGRGFFVEKENCVNDDPSNPVNAKIIAMFLDADSFSGPQILASTYVKYSDTIPEYATIWFYPSWIDASDFGKASTARHEVGHTLGLNHSDFEKCLMFSKLDMRVYNEKLKTVCKDEETEVKRIYERRN